MHRPGSSSSARAYVGALLAVAVWGASFIATKIGVRETTPFTVIVLRFGIGVPLLAGVVAFRRELAWPDRRTLLQLVGLGAIGITIHQWLQTTGLRTAQASTTSWIITATPLTMALVGRVVLGERLRWRQVAGIALGAVGVLLVVSRGSWTSLADGAFGSAGDALVSISTITWALFSVYSRKGLQQQAAAPMMLFVMASGWMLAAIPWLFGGGLANLGRLDTAGWISILFLGVLCSGMAYVFWYDALQVLPAATVGSLLYLEPLVTMVVASVVLGEAITIASLAGGVVILAGVRVATLR